MAIPLTTDNNTVVDFPNAPMGFTVTNVDKMITNNARTLYSDPIQATIREIVTNAYDADHTSVEITLPTETDPNFTVTDHGAGMSKTHVESIYRTLGLSTKTQTNDQTGEKGIGRFAPIAYTDSYTLITNGRVYSIHLDKHDALNLTFIQTDPNPTTGTTVIVPVRPKDFSHFKIKARSVLLTFPDTFWPTDQFGEKPQPVFAPADTNVQIYPTNDDSCIVQGCVQYPLDYSVVAELFPIDAPIRDVFTTNIMFTVPNGTLSTASSREALVLDDTTKANLRAHILAAFEKLQKYMDAYPMTFDGCFDAIESIEDVSYSARTALRGLLRARYPNLIKIALPEDSPASLDYNYITGRNIAWKKDDEIAHVDLSQRHYNSFNRVIRKRPEVYVDFESDKIRNGTQRIKFAFNNDKPESLLWIKAKSPKCPHFKAFMASMYEPTYVRVKDLAEPPKRSTRSTIRAPYRVLQEERTHYSWYRSRSPIQTSDDHPMSVHSVNAYLITDSHVPQTTASTHTALTVAAKLGYPNVYLIPRSRIKEIENDDTHSWINLNDAVQAYYDKHHNDKAERYLDQFLRFQGSDIVHHLNHIDRTDLTFNPKLRIDPPTVDFLTTVRTYLNIPPLDIPDFETTPLGKKLAEIDFHFPLLKKLDSNTDPEAVLEYVELVEAKGLPINV